MPEKMLEKTKTIKFKKDCSNFKNRIISMENAYEKSEELKLSGIKFVLKMKDGSQTLCIKGLLRFSR